MAADGRLTRRAEREVAPFVYAGAAILRPELFEDAPDGRVLADHAVRPRRGDGPAAWAAARRRLDACRHAGGDRAGRGRDPGQRWAASLIPSSAYLWRLCKCRIARPAPAMTQCERHGLNRTARLHDPGVGAVPADADRGVAAGPARARLQAGRRSAGARRRHDLSADAARLPAGAEDVPRRAEDATPRSCRASCRSATSTRTSSPSPRRRAARPPTPRWSCPRRSTGSAARCCSRS